MAAIAFIGKNVFPSLWLLSTFINKDLVVDTEVDFQPLCSVPSVVLSACMPIQCFLAATALWDISKSGSVMPSNYMQMAGYNFSDF